MKFNKKLLWGLPILVGGFLIYKQLRRGKDASQDAPLPPTFGTGGGFNTGGAQSIESDFPLRKGSRNSAVGALQTILNTALTCQNKELLVVDNIFGSKTESALSQITGKTSVSNQVEFDLIRNQLSKSCALSSNLAWSWKMIEAQNSGKYNFLVVREPATMYKVQKDFTGKWISTSPYTTINLPKKNYSLNDYVIRSATNDGRLRIEIMRGEFAGMWLTVAGIDIPKTFNIS